GQDKFAEPFEVQFGWNAPPMLPFRHLRPPKSGAVDRLGRLRPNTASSASCGRIRLVRKPATSSKSQQMRWSRGGADLLLQVRRAVYNGTLGSDFGQRFRPANDGSPPTAIAV